MTPNSNKIVPGDLVTVPFMGRGDICLYEHVENHTTVCGRFSYGQVGTVIAQAQDKFFMWRCLILTNACQLGWACRGALLSAC